MPSITQYIGPRGPVINVRAYEVAIQNAIKDAERHAIGLFERTVASWEHKPAFRAGGNLFDRWIGTQDVVYDYVAHGTRPHVIRPRDPGGKLAFQTGYTAKTSPNVIGSRPGGASGNTVYANEVMHPGTEARNFDTIIAANVQDRFLRTMQNGLRGLQR